MQYTCESKKNTPDYKDANGSTAVHRPLRASAFKHHMRFILLHLPQQREQFPRAILRVSPSNALEAPLGGELVGLDELPTLALAHR